MNRHLTQLSGSLLLTFRELWSTYVTLGLFAVTTLAWVLMSFAMNLDVVEGSVAALRIFGLDTTPTDGMRDPETGDWIQTAVGLESFVIGIQTFVLGASYFLGTLLGVFATAPLTAGLMAEPRIGLLLSKPMPRHEFLLGHVFAVVLTVLILATYLIGSVWLVLSIKTGIWNANFLTAIPLITLMFLVMYSVVLFVSVSTGSSGFALVATYGLIFISIIFLGHESILRTLSGTGAAIFRAFYFALPNFAEGIVPLAQLVEGDPVKSWTPFIASAVFGLVTYSSSFLWFARKDF